MTNRALAYRIEDGILVVTVRGTPTEVDRRSVLQEIAQHVGVSHRTPLLIDGTEADVVPLDVVEARAHRWVELLGAQLGSVCALVVPPTLRPHADIFRVAMGEMNIRVRVFDTVEAARDWLLRANANKA